MPIAEWTKAREGGGGSDPEFTGTGSGAEQRTWAESCSYLQVSARPTVPDPWSWSLRASSVCGGKRGGCGGRSTGAALPHTPPWQVRSQSSQGPEPSPLCSQQHDEPAPVV